MQGQGFDYRLLGNIDYAGATAYVASLPEEVRCKMDNTDKELAVRVLHLSLLRSRKSGTGAAYCWPSLSTLAAYCRRSVRTVERHLLRLATLGIIQWKRRMTSCHTVTSNLYQMGKTFLAMLCARKSKKSPISSPTTLLSNNDLKIGYNAAQGPAQALYTPPEWMKANATSDIASTEASPRSSDGGKGSGGQGTHRPSRHEIVYVARGTQADVDVDARKALLKRQAEALKARGL